MRNVHPNNSNRDVGVGTLDDVADVARTPADAMTLLRERAGFGSNWARWLPFTSKTRPN